MRLGDHTKTFFRVNRNGFSLFPTKLPVVLFPYGNFFDFVQLYPSDGYALECLLILLPMKYTESSLAWMNILILWYLRISQFLRGMSFHNRNFDFEEISVWCPTSSWFFFHELSSAIFFPPDIFRRNLATFFFQRKMDIIVGLMSDIPNLVRFFFHSFCARCTSVFIKFVAKPGCFCYRKLMFFSTCSI